MKYLFSVSAVLAFILSSCVNAPQGMRENAPTSTAFAEEQKGATAAGTNAVEIVGGDEESLRAFIAQWLTPGQAEGTVQDMTVYIGSLPDGLPFDLPAPEDARPIGSITGGWVDYVLIIDTGLSPKSVHAFYAENLADQGWQEPPANEGPGGFIASSNMYSSYCHKEQDAFLNVETLPVSDERTSVRVNLDISPPSFNCDAAIAPGSFYETLIPRLETPSGTTIQSGGASSSDREAEITAHLQTDRSPVQLVEFYNEQLRTTGWKMQDSGDVQASGNGEGAAWSHWTFTDEQENNWRGSLIVVKTSAKNDKLFALLRIERGK